MDGPTEEEDRLSFENLQRDTIEGEGEEESSLKFVVIERLEPRFGFVMSERPRP